MAPVIYGGPHAEVHIQYEGEDYVFQRGVQQDVPQGLADALMFEEETIGGRKVRTEKGKGFRLAREQKPPRAAPAAEAK